MEKGERINKFIDRLEKLVSEGDISGFVEVEIPTSNSPEYYEGVHEGLMLALECFSKIGFSDKDPDVLNYVLWISDLVLKVRELSNTQGGN